MNTTILQVPVKKDLRNKAAAAAHDMGFSSLQAAIRLFLHKLSNKTIHIAFEEPAVTLSKKNARRYDKMAEEVRSGKVRLESYDNARDFMKSLSK